MKNIVLLFALIIGATAISQSYSNAESVEWDGANNRWLVANGSNIIIDDGAGNLSFFGNASASHGMEVVGDILFAIDSNVVKGYMLDDASEVMSLSIPGVAFLNGMGSDATNEMLYISDFGNNKIFSVDVSDLNNPTFVEIVSSTGGTPNGVIFSEMDNALYFVTWGGSAKIKSVDLTDFSVSDAVSNTGVGNIDGIVYDEIEDAYFISSWSPARITRYSGDFSSSEIVNTTSISAPADIGINVMSKIIGIPVGNNVVFSSYNQTAGVNEHSLETLQFSMTENPIKSQTMVQFMLENQAKVIASLFSLDGKKIQELYSANDSSGQVEFLLSNTGLSSGMYLLQLKINNQILTKKVLVE